jgi:cytochrome c-type biogenesis protein CcmH/NrfG
VALAPYYAEPRLYLAVTLEEAGDIAAARAAYGEFLERAKRTDGRRRYAEDKVKALAP